MKTFRFLAMLASAAVLTIATISVTFAQEPTSYESIVRRYIVEFWNRQDTKVVSEVLVSEAVLISPDGVMEGISAIKAFQNTYANAFSDLNFSINDVISTEDGIKVEWILQGTHDGEIAGIAPTWQKVELKGTSTYLLANSKITQEVMLYDKVDLFQQLGVRLETLEEDSTDAIVSHKGVDSSFRLRNSSNKW